jgi:hypothetical protein
MRRRIFISHAGANAAKARTIADYLSSAGLAPLLDREKLGAGDSFLSFMEEGLSTSDYFLLLWSLEAAGRKWVQIEWEAALHRAVSEVRAFLVVGRLDKQPLPSLLAPRLFVDLHPELLPGIEDLVRLWREDMSAEEKSGKPVASNPLLPHDVKGVPVYVTSDLFGVTVPVSIDLSAPAGVVMLDVRERLSLPTSMDHQGQIGIRFDYRLVLDKTPLDPSRPLAEQGVKPKSVLWLECTMRPFANRPPQSGRLEAVTFRGETPESRAMKSANRRLLAAMQAANLA